MSPPPSCIPLLKKFTQMLDSCIYYLLRGIFPLELVTKINPDQVGPVT